MRSRFAVTVFAAVLLAAISLGWFAARWVRTYSGAEETPTITQADLDALVNYWRHDLSLDDWEARAHLERLANFPEGAVGLSHADAAGRFLVIAVLDPRDYAAAAKQNHTVPKVGREIRNDITDTVVHEFVHLRLKELVRADDEHEPDLEEITVNRLTWALLRKK